MVSGVVIGCAEKGLARVENRFCVIVCCNVAIVVAPIACSVANSAWSAYALVAESAISALKNKKCFIFFSLTLLVLV